jgi:hypothetical protein
MMWWILCPRGTTMATFHPGTHIDEHRVIRLLGAGRFAGVHEVVSPGSERRALKILRESVADAGWKAAADP